MDFLHEANIRDAGKPFTSFSKKLSRSLLEKGVKEGGVTPPPPRPHNALFPTDPWILHLKTT
jgi:hypothetical protein